MTRTMPRKQVMMTQVVAVWRTAEGLVYSLQADGSWTWMDGAFGGNVPHSDPMTEYVHSGELERVL